MKNREPIVDGLFYPDTKEALKKELETYFSKARTENKTAQGIISPHSGYTYSADISAKTYLSACARNIKTVVVCGPVHREPEDAIFLSESHTFSTPLGKVLVDQEINESLLSTSTKIYKNDIPHLEEHCLETQIPFIQHLFPSAAIVPILMGKPTKSNVKILSQSLYLTFSDNFSSTLFVVTANLSGYLTHERAFESSELFIKLIRERDWESIINAYHKREISSCGAGCVAALVSLLSDYSVDIVAKGDSKAEHSMNDKLVYYAGISFFRKD